MSESAKPPRRKRSKLPWVVLCVGILMLGGGCGLAISGVVTGFQAAKTWTTPGSVTANLAAGDWTIYEQVPLRSTGTFDESPSRDHDLTADTLTVVGPTGDVPVSCVSCGAFDETLTLGSEGYLGIARFTAPVPGDYTITTETRGGVAMLAPPVGQTVSKAFGWSGIAMLGGLIAVAGLVWLLVQFFGRRRQERPIAVGAATSSNPTAAPGQTPEGWYPDPGGSGHLRWWTGTTWTNDTHPQ